MMVIDLGLVLPSRLRAGRQSNLWPALQAPTVPRYICNSPLTKSSHPKKDTTYGIRMRIGILLVVLPTALNNFVNGLINP